MIRNYDTSVSRADQPLAALTDGGRKDDRAVQVVPVLGERYSKRHHPAAAAQPARESVRLEVRARDVSEGPRASSAVPFSLLLLEGRRWSAESIQTFINNRSNTLSRLLCWAVRLRHRVVRHDVPELSTLWACVCVCVGRGGGRQEHRGVHGNQVRGLSLPLRVLLSAHVPYAVGNNRPAASRLGFVVLCAPLPSTACSPVAPEQMLVYAWSMRLRLQQYPRCAIGRQTLPNTTIYRRNFGAYG